MKNSGSNILRSNDKTWVCVASGPSFSEDQAEQIVEARQANKCRVIVVNDNYKRVPNADIIFASDGKWWDKYIEEVKRTEILVRWTTDNLAAAAYGLGHFEQYSRLPGLSWTWGKVHGANGGYNALNLVALIGAKKIVLVGYDMQRTYGKAHWFGDHPEGLWNYHPDDMFAAWARQFPSAAKELKERDIDCVNCSIRTALDCFRKSTLGEELS